MPAALQAELVVKILSFDRNLAADAGDEVVVGVLVQRRYRASLEAAEEFAQAMAALPPQALGDLRLRCQFLDAEPAAAGRLLAETGVHVLYIPPLRALSVEHVTAEAAARHVRSFTGVPEYVADGVAVGLGVRGDRPEILINLTAALAAGADFNSQLLKLAKILR